MSYMEQSSIAFGGMWGKGGQSTQKAFGAQNVGKTAVCRGRFVALVEGGVCELSAAADVVAGVVVGSTDKAVYDPHAYLSVASLPAGDAIWVELEGGAKVGDSVFICMVAEAGLPSGVIKTEELVGKTLKTDFRVIIKAGNLALIGKLI